MKNYQQYIPSHYQQSFFDNYRVKLTLGQTLFQLILGGMMLGHGFREDCNNGATDYLFTGGAIIVATHILPFIKAICHLPSIICVTNPNESHSLTPSLPHSLLRFLASLTLLCIQFCLSLVSFGVTIWVGKVLHRDF